MKNKMCNNHILKLLVLFFVIDIFYYIFALVSLPNNMQSVKSNVYYIFENFALFVKC